MTLWAIVPVKPLRSAKSRLSGVLTRDEREILSQRMLINTLDLLAKVKEIERTLVVSRDSKALSIARKHGARTVAEHGAPELNSALVRATVVAQQYDTSGVLVLPADLPLLRMDDIEKLIFSATDPPVVVIAPDRHGSGTNALLSSPPGLIEYDFGPDSFERHVERTKAAGASLVVCEIPSIGLDVDLPEDLEYLRENLDIEFISDLEERTS
ncbi:MAG: 2-phospho-L-lactate guanylyltransferase [Anaerolineales bacterium]|nr:2-phospho-L-lactate guanylyltransferase [Anaerolineales bacterium]MCK5634140.1 2-phospho-L-lactate guanylyltransferase [Anaerolineales bacterium]